MVEGKPEPLITRMLLSLEKVLWRDKIDVPSQCTIVRTIGRPAYSSKPNTQNKQLHSVWSCPWWWWGRVCKLTIYTMPPARDNYSPDHVTTKPHHNTSKVVASTISGCIHYRNEIASWQLRPPWRQQRWRLYFATLSTCYLANFPLLEHQNPKLSWAKTLFFSM